MEEKAGNKERVRFFNVSLVNANVMSVPRFPQPQRLVGEVIHSVEVESPRFAWIQFLFRRANLSSTLVGLKNAIHSAATIIKTPKTSLIDGSEHDRAELHRDWYEKSGGRMKKIDTLINTPHVLLAIQGMWVGDPRSLSALPFKDCYDDQDRLGVFVYQNPQMLLELVGRRMVENVSSYFLSYTSSRLEPPSFMVTQEEVPYYVHLPIAKQTDFLKSLSWKQHSSEVREGTVEGVSLKTGFPHSNLVKLGKVPWIDEPLKEKDTERLSLLPSTTVRSFELLFTSGRTEIVLSSRSERDVREYVGVLESVYGELDIVGAPAAPDFLREVPRIVGLVP
jgi:hypothetical protein